MSFALRHKRNVPGLWLVLACLAVVLKVLVPPGFMVAGPVHHTPFPLVLCTAQGMVTVDAGAPSGEASDPDGQPGGQPADGAPCAFAAAAQFAPPPGLVAPDLVEFASFQAIAPRPLVHLAPGRGLAAPPLPARGPPNLPT
ncbi:DUF2946 family protein [Phenylobacterium sp.]|uniref:DUF2946 family protein n=1 Tax=Phenylobacterium sp. TaxID=1871053 RepID=UPI002FE2A422